MPHSTPLKAAFKGAAIYAVFGFLWILLSDRLLLMLVQNQQLVNELQTYKGWFYIFITALLVFWLIYGHLRSLHTVTMALKTSEHNYRRLVNNAGDAIFLFDQRGDILDANPTASTYTGYERDELIGSNISLISKTLKQQEVEELLLKIPPDTTRIFEETHQTKDSPPVNVEVTLCRFEEHDRPLYLALVRDITERLRNQELAVQTEKMITVGGLAAGMAHELNNPLGVILQALQGVHRRMSSSLPANKEVADELGLSLELMAQYNERREVTQYLRAAEDSGKRAAHIVRSMLDFARRDETCSSQCDLYDVIELSIELAEKDFDLKQRLNFRPLNIVRDYSTGLTIQCKQSEIGQVLLNLLKNAAYALAETPPKQGEPTIHISARKAVEGVTIIVADNGPGMDEATRKQAMDPFFTTKPPGQGTGLGLSVSYFIITRNHNGTLRVHSKPGEGTRFEIYLPAVC